MLTFMREKFKSLSWMLWAVVLSLVAWHFGVGFGGGYGGGGAEGGAVAVVDGSEIGGREYARAVDNLERRLRSIYGASYTPEVAKQFGVRQTALDQLIERRIALREADRLGLKATPDEIRERLIETFTAADGTFPGAARVDRSITRAGHSRTSFEQLLADDIMYERLRLSLGAVAVVPDERLRETYIEENNTLETDYVVFDPADHKPEAEPSKRDVKRWFDAHREDYTHTQRQARYVSLPLSAYEADVELDEAKLSEYFDSQSQFKRFDEKRRARHILLRTGQAAGGEGEDEDEDATRQKAESIAAEARAGKDFAALAQQHSQDTSNASQGGDLGFFPAGRMVPEFDEAVFAAAPQEIVGPIKTSFGYHVIQLLEVQPAKTFDEARAEIETELRQQETRKLARQAASDLIAQSKTLGLAEAAKAPGLGSELTPVVGETATELGIDALKAARVPAFVKLLFRLEKPGDVHASPFDADDALVVFALEQESEPTRHKLDAVRDRVVADIQADRAGEALQEAIDKFGAELLAGKTFAEAASAISLEARSSPRTRPNGTLPGVPRSNELVAKAFEQAEGDTIGPEAVGDLKVMLLVKKKFSFDEAVYDDAKPALKARLEGQLGGELWTSLIRSIRTQLTDTGRLRILRPDLLT